MYIAHIFVRSAMFKLLCGQFSVTLYFNISAIELEIATHRKRLNLTIF